MADWDNGMIGGLGGLGGFDPMIALAGQALMRSPSNNPLGALPQLVADYDKRQRRANGDGQGGNYNALSMYNLLTAPRPTAPPPPPIQFMTPDAGNSMPVPDFLNPMWANPFALGMSPPASAFPRPR